MKRNRRLGAVSLAFTGVFLAVILLLNVIVAVLGDRMPLQIDLTQSNLLSMGEQSRAILSALREDVSIIVVSAEKSFLEIAGDDGRALGSEVAALLKAYAQGSDHISLQFMDPLQNPAVFKKYAAENMMENSIIVESAKRFRVVSPNVFYVEDSSRAGYFYAEQEMTAAILYVTADNLSSAAIVTGHNEFASGELAGAIDILERNAFSVAEIDMKTQSIDEQTALLLIISPMVDFTDKEIEQLEQHLSRRGHLIVSFDPDTPQLPNLERYLKEYGVRYLSDILVDKDGSLAVYETPLATTATYQSNEGIEDFSVKGRAIAAPFARVMERLWDSEKTRTAMPFLNSTKTAFTLPYAQFEENTSPTFEKTEDSLSGPLPLGILTADVIGDSASYVLFLSSSDFFSDVFIRDPSYANGDLFAALAGMFGGNSSLITIAPKSLGSPMLITTKDQQDLISSLLYIVPLLFMLFGIVLYFRRRNL